MEDVQIDATVPVDPNVTSLCSPEIPNFEFVSDATEKLEIGDISVDDCDDSLGDSMVCDPISRLVPTSFTTPNRIDETIMFINAGGDDSKVLDSELNILRDTYFEGGDVLRTEESIVEAGDYPFIYQSARVGNFCYRLNNLLMSEESAHVSVPRTSQDYIKRENCATEIEISPRQKRLMRAKAHDKYEKKITELSERYEHKTNECHEAWMLLYKKVQQQECSPCPGAHTNKSRIRFFKTKRGRASCIHYICKLPDQPWFNADDRLEGSLQQKGYTSVRALGFVIGGEERLSRLNGYLSELAEAAFVCIGGVKKSSLVGWYYKRSDIVGAVQKRWNGTSSDTDTDHDLDQL